MGTGTLCSNAQYLLYFVFASPLLGLIYCRHLRHLAAWLLGGQPYVMLALAADMLSYLVLLHFSVN